jgi:hypothetical protein
MRQDRELQTFLPKEDQRGRPDKINQALKLANLPTFIGIMGHSPRQNPDAKSPQPL